MAMASRLLRFIRGGKPDDAITSPESGCDGINIDELVSAPHDFQEIRIENTNRCGYSCVFCPREKMDRPQDIMPMDDLGLVMERVAEYHPHYKNWFHLHGYGEPLLDKYLPEKIVIAKSMFPRSKTWIITTLGVNVGEDYLRALIHNGLDTINVSFYGSTRDEYKAASGTSMFETALKNLIAVGKIAKSVPSCRVIVSAGISGSADKAGIQSKPATWLQSLFDTSGFEVWSPELHNSGIGRAYNPPDAPGLCSVFNGRRRNILQISWDLNVQPCTFDFNASMKLGNLRTQSIAEILNGEPYRALALAQSTGDLSSYPVCANCDRKRDR
jgi:MoaA/NifB/PqqE/SkfB family radical SAM enzyme